MTRLEREAEAAALLTPRMREALAWRAEGLTCAQVASAMGTSAAAVRSLLHEAYGRLGVPDALAALIKTGLWRAGPAGEERQ